MAKEPYKDPFTNLPRRICGVVVEEAADGQKTKAELATALQAPRTADKVAIIKKHGPKKGAGGHPQKGGAISKRTKQRRKKTEPS